MKPAVFTAHPKQRAFLDSAADIAIYGGAAGGGKSWTLLYDPIAAGYHEVPGFYGVIFRRTYPEITNSGGLWDEAAEIYRHVKGNGVRGALEYRFPSGARIAFRHLETEQSKFSYQGAQICYLAFDELPHFSEGQFRYMISRNRSTCGVKPYIRCTLNPDPGWVRSRLLGPWVDTDYNGPRAEPGAVLYVTHRDGNPAWSTEWVPEAQSITFHPARVTDNPALLSKDPGYVTRLQSLPPIDRARLLDGNWDVKLDGLVYPGFDQCVVEDGDGGDPEVGGVDFGLRNPFAAIWGRVDYDGVLWITGCRYVRETTIPDHARALPRNVKWWCDPAGAEQIAQLRHGAHHALPCVHRPVRNAQGETRTPKLSGIDMVKTRIATGRLKMVRRACAPLIRELGAYIYDPDSTSKEEPLKENDHACDALRYLVTGLDRHSYMNGFIVRPSVEERAVKEAAIVDAAAIERLRACAALRADVLNEHWWNN